MDFRKRFRSDIDLAQKVISEVLGMVDGRLNSDNLFDLRLILNELICNSIIHGNRKDGERYVDLYLYMDDMIVEITVSDEGDGVKVNNRYNVDELKPGGRGLILVKRLSDDFQIDGSTVKIRKKLA
ncbi:serine/threonine-protein kinase RsbW [Dethiosulfatibacter aminovorans DSM 17477]|uniref:Serine/threonine-protein kinase RsbW n=1 Tax=Dethiosulfatibacter aminovorans DSM 17477 TaxID=1121476 RepID=A0A1M6K100_9FIRM|nr:ATP-binding protein [Dethiosulfatibacter aminovorans]SHJ52651.1 serine/threonine-protein kinase RsbW [Dethiosulfatibacter aminovorans DSM 17477]